MNNELDSSRYRYKLGTSNIVAIIIGVVSILLIAVLFFKSSYDASEIVRNIVFAAIVALVATLFGTSAGTLTAFLGAICSAAICNAGITWADPVALALIGLFIGQFADKYGIREHSFNKTNVLTWNLVHLIALIMAFVFVKPWINYIIYNKDIFDSIKLGARITAFSLIVVGAGLTILFCLISRFMKRKTPNNQVTQKSQL